MTVGRREYLSDLKAALSVALKNENLAEANRIKSTIDVVSRSAASGGAGFPDAVERPLKEITVVANHDWAAAVQVHKGDRLRIRADGQWSLGGPIREATAYGPDGMHSDGTSDGGGEFMRCPLMGRIGPRVFSIGKGTEITAESDGSLELRCNDYNLPDNVGSMHVTISALVSDAGE